MGTDLAESGVLDSQSALDAVNMLEGDAPAVGAPAVATSAAERSRYASIGDYLSLTKPRIVLLLLVTTLIPMYLAGDAPPSGWLVLWVMLGGFLAAGGANALNQFLDRDIDHVMPRTRKRPLPGGRLAPWQVLLFGVASGAASFALLWYTANLLTAIMGMAGLLFYVFIYTRFLKRSSTQNIVIGGAAGSFPPLVGWAAVANDISLLPIILFLLIFYWTPPHFWALALMRQREYRAAGVPMLPVVAGDRETWRQILLYSVLMAITSLLPVALLMLGPLYLVCAVILNGIFLWQAWEILRSDQNQTQRNQRIWRLYKYSLLYLALLFFAMGLDRLFYVPPADLVDFVIKLPW